MALYGYTVPTSEKDACHMAADLPNMVRSDHEDTRTTRRLASILSIGSLAVLCLQDQMSEDLFAGQEEEDSSVDDLTPSVTSNGSDAPQRPPGTAPPC